jgi:pyruvate formate lyase activating enzyme
MMDIARLSRKAKMKNVVVTNGFISPEPLAELIEVTDAFNVDMKAFTEDFYLTQTMSKLEPVKESLLQIRRSGRHLEITNLIIPNRNDDKAIFEEMIRWIREELGSDTVLHLSRYFPTYKMSEPPTPVEMLQDLYALASAHLQYVYVGNSSGGDSSNTYCPSCHQKVIDRSRYDAWLTGLTKTGQCAQCGHQVLNYI